MSRRNPIRNGIYATAEYAAPQLAMLLLAPLLLQRLGAAQLGIWMLATAAVSSGALISAGFGDAAVKFVSTYRGRDDRESIARVVQAMLLINLCAGTVLALILCIIAPFIAAHMAHMDTSLQRICVASLRIGGVLLLLRSLEGVFVSTLRGFEQYAVSSRITLAWRLSVLAAAAVLAIFDCGVIAIMQVTLLIAVLGVIAQVVYVRRLLPGVSLMPSSSLATLTMLAGYGCFTWLQVIAAILFSQADRVLVGIILGPSAVAYYGICTQAAQPIHGLASAGFHALFPHLSARVEHEPIAKLRTTVMRALRTNALLAAALSLPLILGSHALLLCWMGPTVADAAWIPLLLLALSYGLLSLNVTAHFTLLALGEVRRVTWFNLAAATATLLLMFTLMPRFGLTGAASARLLYGPVSLALYSTVFHRLRVPSPHEPAVSALQEVA